MTAGDLRQGPLKQQTPESESRDQRGPDKKDQLLDPEDYRLSESNSYREAPGRREERRKLQTLLEPQSDLTGWGWGGRGVEVGVQPRAALLKGASLCVPDQPKFP